MRDNALNCFLEKIHNGRIPSGAVITFADPSAAELAADAGFDFCWIDGEHGEFDRFSAMLSIMALKGTGCAAFYRVPACSHTEIKKIIDFAPAGIIIPMIMNGQDAELAVAACRYPPRGNRGCGFRRAVGYGADPIQEYLKLSETQPLVIIQIEHISAVENLDAILAVPGIGSILVGPYDLSASMGKTACFDDPEVASVFDEVCRKSRAAGKILGAYTESSYDLWLRRGVQYFGCVNDTAAMLEGFRTKMRKIPGNHEAF